MRKDNKIIYIVPSWHCTLHCPHCYVHTYPDNYNEIKFINTLKKLKEDYSEANFVLHGGEPTLYKDRYNKIMDTGIITSICSNLITNKAMIDDINTRNITTSTSWNPNRFIKDSLFSMWLDNIEKLNNKPLILITLDQDLLEYDIKDFIKLIHSLEEVGIIEILFEVLVDNKLDDSFQNKVDEWLCNIYDVWRIERFKIKNVIEDQILDWDFRCNSLTLLPEGDIRKGCILGDECHKILKKCLTCKLASVCRPCVLHSRCSFFPKFYEKVKANA